jgi:dTDP-4-dehydrorhamnose reductase
MKVLVLGASGMIGSTTLRVLSERRDWEVYGTVRCEGAKRHFADEVASRLVANVDVIDQDALVGIFSTRRPDVVINCVGATKHKTGGNDPLTAISLNALLPHRLSALCAAMNARLIHVSTDCVFSGKQGNYTEESPPDAEDVYGKSKAMGEVSGPHSITLRTSTIGHELQSNYGLLNWFLSQKGSCKGFRRAMFSGLPTVVFAQVIRDVVIPSPNLHGLFNVAGDPIAKYDLLQLIATTYGKSIEIVPDDDFAIDRTLSANRFFAVTGFKAPAWSELIKAMHAYH